MASMARVGTGTRPVAVLHDVTIVLAGISMLVLASRVVVPLPGSPVPMTAQALAVLLAAAWLGRARAVASVMGFLGLGAMGAPVFAYGGGIGYLLTPTAGYLWGFAVAAWLLGGLADRGWTRRPLTLVAGLVLGQAAIYACGLAWLAGFIPAGQVLTLGLIPFLPVAAVQVVLAATILLLRRRRIG